MRRSSVAVSTVVITVAAVLALGVGTAAPAPLADAELSAALLEPGDVPDAGWEAAAAGTIEPEPHTQSSATAGGWCGGLTDAYTAGELPIAGSASTTLSKVVSPDEPYWFIWQQLWSFDESDGATAVANAKSFLATIKAVIAECPDGWTTSGGEILNSVTPEVVPWPRVGNQRLAVELTTAGDGVTDTTHVVYVRVSSSVVSVHTRVLPADESLLRKIVKRAAKHLKQAVADA